MATWYSSSEDEVDPRDLHSKIFDDFQADPKVLKNRGVCFRINRVLLRQGRLPSPQAHDASGQPLNYKQTNIRTTLEALSGLESLAYQLHYTWGGQGSISKLMEAIGQGLYVLTVNPAILDTSENDLNRDLGLPSDAESQEP